MDRNAASALVAPNVSLSARRAWIEIRLSIRGQLRWMWSLSARRAWIEISLRRPCLRGSQVALRKESVDRNRSARCRIAAWGESLSARRAWIEMASTGTEGAAFWSLSARRAWIEIPSRTWHTCCRLQSLSARRVWIEMVTSIIRRIAG